MADGGVLAGKVAIVTGAGSGMGRAIAKLFAAEGATVAAADVVGDAVKETCDAIASQGGKASAYQVDVTSSSAVQEMVRSVASAAGGIDVLVNGAGIEGSVGVGILEYEDAMWQRVLDTNLTGAFFTMKHAIPHMLERGGGTIVNIASIAGIVGAPGAPAYCASKGGLVQLTKSVALEFGARNIRVNCVCPGSTRTPMSARIRSIRTTPVPNPPIGRISEPEEQAAVVLFLASPQSSFMTGAIVPVDGGAVAM
jgi:NAD(P)-dependent dehydrogenase (short-subunit alcohol dehydrogenase family)